MQLRTLRPTTYGGGTPRRRETCLVWVKTRRTRSLHPQHHPSLTWGHATSVPTTMATPASDRTTPPGTIITNRNALRATAAHAHSSSPRSWSSTAHRCGSYEWDVTRRFDPVAATFPELRYLLFYCDGQHGGSDRVRGCKECETSWSHGRLDRFSYDRTFLRTQARRRTDCRSSQDTGNQDARDNWDLNDK